MKAHVQKAYPPHPTSDRRGQTPPRVVDHLFVAGLTSIASLLPVSNGRCGIYVLSFADGEYYVGQAVNVVSRYRDHRKTHPDLTELRFWRVPECDLDAAEQAEIRRLQLAGLPLRNVTNALGRLGAGRFDSVVGPAEQDAWLASAPSDQLSDGARPDSADQRRLHSRRFARLNADPRFQHLVRPLRRYVAWTMPFPRRTELAFWSLTAVPGTSASWAPRMLTLSAHSVETLFVCAPAADLTQTIIRVNVDEETVLKRWGTAARLRSRFPWLSVEDGHYYQSRPGTLGFEVYRPRDLERLLNVPRVNAAARRLNLDLMRKGPTIHWKHHCPDLADVVLEPATEEPARRRAWFRRAPAIG